MRPTVLTLVAGLALATTGCVAPGASTEPEAPAGLQQPTFTPLATEAATQPESPTQAPTTTETATAGTPTSGASAPADAPTSAATDAPTSSEPPPAAGPATEPAATTPRDDATAPPAVRGTLADDTEDLRGLAATRAPEHADLRDLELVVDHDQAQIRIAFAAPAPESADDDSILNIATYHDVTGDGRIDYEIWTSLTADGWGTSWFDIREGTARYAADDDVEVEVVDGVVVLTFSPNHLGGARSGRWLASSEWGSAVDMRAGASAEDDAPDERTGQPWPS